MVSTRKKRQSNRRLLSQIDDLDQDILIGITASERQENFIVNENCDDRVSTVDASGDILTTTEDTVTVIT